MNVDELGGLAADGAPTEELTAHALRLLRRPAASVEGAWFDDDVQAMAVRLTGGTMIHGGHAAGLERMRGARLLAALVLALRGDGVHVITADEETARAEGTVADALFGPLGISVGTLQGSMTTNERRSAHAADMTFGAFGRFALDSLHDGRITTPAARLRRDVPAALVLDPGQVMIANLNNQITLLEQDRTPRDQLRRVAEFVTNLLDGVDYHPIPGIAAVRLTSNGLKKTHDAYGVIDPAGMQALLLEKRVMEAIVARTCRRGEDYELVDGEVVRAASGALPSGFGFTGGLRQAIEIKECVTVSDADWIVAATTATAYFRKYQTVGGTSSAELMFTPELREIFGLEVWDRRTTQETEIESRHAVDIGRYPGLMRSQQARQVDRLCSTARRPAHIDRLPEEQA